MKSSVRFYFRRFKPIKSLVSTVFYLGLMAHAYAQNTSTSSLKLPAKSPNLLSRIESRIEQAHKYISSEIIDISLRIDDLLGRDDIKEETPDSNVNIKTMARTGILSGQSFSTQISTKLSLPRTQKRLQLFADSIREDIADSLVSGKEIQKNTPIGSDKAKKGESFTAGLRHMFLNTKWFHLHADFGASFSMPMVPYVRIKARQSFERKKFSARFTQHAYDYIDKEYGFEFGLIFDRPLNSDFHLRQSNRANFTDTRGFYEFEHALNLIQPLGRKRSLVYIISTTGSSSPTLIATSYNFGVTYRRPIGWPWMTLEITPLIGYLRTNDFAPNPGVTVQLETIFGAI